MVQEFRKPRKSAEITKLLEKASPRTTEEYSMGVKGYERSRDWRRELRHEMHERGLTSSELSFNRKDRKLYATFHKEGWEDYNRCFE